MDKVKGALQFIIFGFISGIGLYAFVMTAIELLVFGRFQVQYLILAFLCVEMLQIQILVNLIGVVYVYTAQTHEGVKHLLLKALQEWKRSHDQTGAN